VAAIALLLAIRGVLNERGGRGNDRSQSARREISLEDVTVTQLTSTGTAAEPAISPDGKYVVYLQLEPEGNASVWLRQTAATSSVKLLAAEEGVRTLAATPGPDNSFIDVMRTNGIWRIPFLGGTPKLVVDRPSSPIGWSPNGKFMAFIRPNTERRGQDLVVADPEGSNERVVTTSSGQSGGGFATSLPGSMAIAPAWSPDGEEIAVFKRLSEDVRDIGIAVFEEDDGNETVVKAFGDVPFGAAWLDQRTLLVAQALEQGTPSQIWRISYPDGQRERLTNDVNRYAIVSLSADGDSLVTTRLESRIGVWVGDARGNGHDVLNGLPFLSNAGQYATVGWDDSNVLFTHTLNGRFEIFRMPPDGSGSPEAVVAGRDMSVGRDGTIVYRSLTGDDVGLWKVDRDGRTRVQLAKGSISYPLITPDGKEVVFSSAATGVQMLYRVPIAGGTPVPIVEGPVGILSFSDVSPDGKSIAVVLDRRQWNVCDYPACANRRPIEIPGFNIRWTPDGKGLTYIGADAMNLWTLPLDGSAPHQLTRFSDGRPIEAYAWSHDGKRLAVSRLMSVSSDIVLFTGLRRGR
jgi:Tol biopolymer transport system component